jgi:hypothetical protein
VIVPLLIPASATSARTSPVMSRSCSRAAVRK